jgi:hypothetical protein
MIMSVISTPRKSRESRELRTGIPEAHYQRLPRQSSDPLRYRRESLLLSQVLETATHQSNACSTPCLRHTQFLGAVAEIRPRAVRTNRPNMVIVFGFCGTGILRQVGNDRLTTITEVGKECVWDFSSYSHGSIVMHNFLPRKPLKVKTCPPGGQVGKRKGPP